jgi:hypothetical protein
MSNFKIFRVKENLKMEPTLFFVLVEAQLHRSLIVVISYKLLNICRLKSLYNQKSGADIRLT